MKITTYTLYYNLPDFPGRYVAREFTNGNWTGHYRDSDSLEAVRRWVYEQQDTVLRRSPRQEQDLDQIIESWI